jgi:regulator of RNase E activity RraA
MKALATLFLCLPLGAQVFELSREEMIRLTPNNPYERFADGRPKVPDSLLERARELSAEDCWGVLMRNNYRNSFEGNFKTIHPDRKLAGRALTAMYMPERPDLNSLVMSGLKEKKGFPRGGHQYVIDQLQPGDVLVVDAFGSTPGFVGDNLATYIAVATKTGGLVIDGGIRDLEGMRAVDAQIYYRFAHPDAVRGATLVGFNVPVRIGGVTVMPGDVIVGDREGITVVPPDLIQKIVDGALEIKVHDEWTKMKLRTGKYKSHEIYGSPLDPALIQEYEEYKKKRLAELQTQR